MKLLKQLYGIHSPSGQEIKIKRFIQNHIEKNIPGATYGTDKIGNIYITKGESETYPCIVAHLDQVQRIHSKDFRAVETNDIIFGYSPSLRQREGLGADDKNGIWIALQCLQKYDTIKVAFFVAEEIGCVGSNAADLTFFQDCRFVIEPDRRGHADLITEISGEPICSKEFITDINPARFGYKPSDGMMTDVEILRDNGLALSCINVSCGYYEPHTDNEFTVKRDLLNCLALIQHIIENCTGVYHYEVNLDRQSYFYRNQDSIYELYDYYYEMLDEIIQANPRYTKDEIWETYSVNFPELSEDEFDQLFEDYQYSTGFDPNPEPAPRWASTKSNTQSNRNKKKTKKKEVSGMPYFAWGEDIFSH